MFCAVNDVVCTVCGSSCVCSAGPDGEEALYESVRHFQTLPGRVSIFWRHEMNIDWLK